MRARASRATLVKVVSVTTVVIAAVVTSPRDAYADTPFYSCNSTHCYSIGVGTNSYSGLEGQWNDRLLSIPNTDVNNGYHITNEMWLGEKDNGYIEEGLARYCTTPLAPNETCTQSGGADDKIVQFYATTTAGVTYTQKQYYHKISTVAADNANHVYEIWDSSNGANNKFEVYLDYNPIAQVGDQTYPVGNSVNVGMELVTTALMSASAPTAFQNNVQDYLNSRGTWANINFSPNVEHDSSSWNGTDNLAMDPCSNFANGNCLTWAKPSNSEWDDSKPSS